MTQRTSSSAGVADSWVFDLLTHAHTAIVSARQWRRRAIAFTAGAASVLAMAPFFFWPILFLTLPVLVWLLDTSGPSPLRRAAIDGWWFGFGYFFLGLFWIGEAFLVEAHIFGWLLPFAVTLMPAGIALFTALTTVVARAYWPSGFARIVVLALAFGAGEWVRGHALTGFPWNVIGYALTYPLSLMQSAAVIGIYGLTLWAVVIFAAPLVMLVDASRTNAARSHALRTGALVSLLPLILMYAYGLAQLSNGPVPTVAGVKLRIVQPSVPQREKWLSEKQSGIFADHLAMSRTNANGRIDDLAGITHVIWPEASMPFLPLARPIALKKIGELLPTGSFLIAGALRIENSVIATDKVPYRNPDEPRAAPQTTTRPKVFNSLMAFSADGELVALYDKIHLVPFGEYLPFQRTLESIGLQSLTRLRGGFNVGITPRPLTVVSGLPPMTSLICYEVIFPTELIEGGKRPGVLVNLTNDGWFGNTTGPHQHFHKSRVRAVEEGLPLLRAANNGISAVVDPYGRVLHKLDLNERGNIDSLLPIALPPTLYAVWKDWTFAVNFLIFLAFVAVARARSSPQTRV